MSHAVKLSSVWPISFQYHSQAAATGMLAMQNGDACHGCAIVQTFKEAESSV